MRSLALSALCVMSAFLVAACGDNLVPPAGNDDPPVVDDDMPVTGETPPGTPTTTPQSDHGHDMPRAITAALDINSPSCEAATASFEVLASHSDDATFVKNAHCRVAFDDGAVSELCLGEHTFVSPGAHTFTVEVQDLDTGAIAHAEVRRIIATPLAVDLAVDVPACGLEVAFKATLSTRADVHVSMSPADKVVEPLVVGATGPICVREASRMITLTACCDQ